MLSVASGGSGGGEKGTSPSFRLRVIAVDMRIGGREGRSLRRGGWAVRAVRRLAEVVPQRKVEQRQHEPLAQRTQ